MTDYRHIEIEQRGAVRWLWLNRPEVRNAFNDVLIAEISTAFADVEASAETRVVVVAARGQVFCAGADLNWMRTIATLVDSERATRKTTPMRSRWRACSTPCIRARDR